MIARRHLLAGSAAMLATRAARAADAAVTVGTWGGDYGALLQQLVDTPLMRPQGIDITQDVASNDPRRIKLLSERGSRRGSFDVACINDIDTFLLTRADVLAELDQASVPRRAAILPVFQKPNTVPHIYSALAVLYNPAKIPVPPASYADILDPKYKGRVGLSDLMYSYNQLAVNLALGGPMNDLATGQKALLDWKATTPHLYPSNEALAAGFKSEEVWIGLMWIARGFMWKSAGIPVAWSVPAAGAIPVLFEAGMPRNARARDPALKYLNAMLDPVAQAGFAARMGYVPTVSDAKLPGDLAQQIGLTERQQEALHPLDYAFMQERQGAIVDFWEKQFKA